MRAGLLHIYHGGGKGKTTAAAGLCLRAAGHGLRVGFAQFLKDGSSGECAALKVLPGVTVFDALPHVPFTFSTSYTNGFSCAQSGSSAFSCHFRYAFTNPS